VGGEIDLSTGILVVEPGTRVSLGLMLVRDDVASVRVVVLDPKTDAVLAQSDDIPLELGS
jgi:hypothetical protein